MSDRPESTTDEQPANGGGWHDPKRPSLWKSTEESEPAAEATWRKVKALPDEVAQEPAKEGLWHRPAPEDTRFSEDDEISVPERPAEAAPEEQSPEDMIAEILRASGQRAAPPPEDMSATGAAEAEAEAEEAQAAAQPAPEDFSLPQQERSDETSDEGGDETGDMSELEALGAMDDDDAFAVSEYLALASLQDQAQPGDEFRPEEFEEQDLSPAQQAIFNAAQRASEELPDESDELDVDEAEAVAEPDSESAANYARRMAQQYAGEGEQAEAEARIGDLMKEGTQQEGESAADYARRMAQQYAGEGAAAGDDTSQLAGTQPYQQLSPEEQELADKFRETRRQVTILKQMYDNGQIDYNELQNRLRQHTIMDDDQNWWMIGIESNQWYRYDNATGQWVEAQPPVPLDEGQRDARTETGELDPNDVIAGSLPYLPEDGEQTLDIEDSDYDPSQYNAAQQEYSQQYGVPTDEGDTPIPRPGQPTVDPNQTMVGSSVDKDTLDSAADTLEGIRFVDEQGRDAGATVRSQPAVGDEYESVEAPYQQEADYAPEYDYQDQAPPQEYQAQQQRERASLVNYAIIGGLVILALFACGVISLGVGGVVWYNQTVEPYQNAIASLANYQPDFQTVRILDANGDLIQELTNDEGAREPVRVQDGEVSPYFIHAIVSAENQTFYEDPGFSLPAIGRAFLQNLGAGEIQSGASTITQQVARNLVLRDAAVTAQRKATEIAVASEIARNYTKNEILNLYINETFFGNQSYGVEAASQFYFGIPAADLNMAQAALLAGIIQAPAANDPVINREQSFRAMRNVIRLMIENGCVNFNHGRWASDDEAFCVGEDVFVEDEQGNRVRLLRETPTGYGGYLSVQLGQLESRPYQPREARFVYPHFVNYIQGQVEAIYGENAMFQRGFTIYTTLIPRIQDGAQSELRNRVDELRGNGVNTGAVLVADPSSGAIRALVGSPDFTNEEIAGQVDNTRTWQQSGSAIKPVVYTAAMQPNGEYLTPASILWDVPSTYQLDNGTTYSPTNFRSGEYRGNVPLRFALQNSLNIPAVKAYNFIGPDRFQSMAGTLGLSFLPEAQFGLSSALGANDVRLIDMVQAYSTLASDGLFNDLYAIERITERDADGNEIDVPLQERPSPQQAISPQLAYVMQNILSDDTARAAEFGTGSALTLANLGLPADGYAAAKTGTSNDGRDLWTVGFTNTFTVGVWLGTFDNSPTRGQTGFTAAAPVWNRVMARALTTNPGPFENPGGVIFGTVCRETGTLAEQGTTCINNARANEVWIGSAPPPPPTQGFLQTLQVDSWTGRIANQFCNYSVIQQTFVDIDDPFALNWLQTTQRGQQVAQRLGLAGNLQAPPQQSCEQSQPIPTVEINNPSEGQVLSGDVPVRGVVSAENLGSWQILIAPAGTENFQQIAQGNQQLPQGGTFVTWDSRSVNNGQYTMRLRATNGQTGGFINRNVQVTIENVPPTPTPTPSPLPTQAFPSPLPPGSTPLPFDEATATPTATLEPF